MQFVGEGDLSIQTNARLLDVPDVRQSENWDCGAAAVMAVCKHFGVGPTVLSAYAQALGATESEGTPPTAVAAFLSQQGLAVTSAHKMGIDDLGRFHAAGQPVLCPCRPDGSGTTGHWVVVIGTGLGQVFLHDPACGRRMLSEMSGWLDGDRDAGGVDYDRFGIAVGQNLPVAIVPGTAEEGDQERMKQTLKRVLGDAMGRMIRRLGHQVRRAAMNPRAFAGWLDAHLWNDNAGVMSEAIEAPLAAWSMASGRDLEAGDVAGRLAADVREALLRASGETNFDGLAVKMESTMVALEKGDVWTLGVGKYLTGE